MKKIAIALLVLSSFSSYAFDSRPESLFMGVIKKVVQQTDEGCLVRVGVTQIWESVLNPVDRYLLEDEGLITPYNKCSELKEGDHIDGIAFIDETNGKIYLE